MSWRYAIPAARPSLLAVYSVHYKQLLFPAVYSVHYKQLLFYSPFYFPVYSPFSRPLQILAHEQDEHHILSLAQFKTLIAHSPTMVEYFGRIFGYQVRVRRYSL
jgi:hypothetical protein